MADDDKAVSVSLADQLRGATDINACFCIGCGQPDEPHLHDRARCPGMGGVLDAVPVADALAVFDQSCEEEPDLDEHGRALHCAIVALRLNAGNTIPADILAHVKAIGRVEWGQTHAHDAEGHGRHVADSVRLTAAHFDQSGEQHMHGLWLEGTKTVLCHTGTSPNAPDTTRALVGAWNWLVDLAAVLPYK